MSQDLTIRNNSAPIPQSRVLGDMLAGYRNRTEETPMGKLLISRNLAPSATDVAMMEARQTELRASLRPTDPELIVPRIGRLFLRFPSAKIDNPAATAAAYAQDLASFPLWAVDAGILKLLQGRGLNSSDFVPSSIVVRDAVNREVSKINSELAQIRAILSVEIVEERSPERRNAVKAMLVQTIEELQSNNRKDGLHGKAENDEQLRERLAKTPMPPLSDALRRSLKLTATKSEASA